MHVYIVAVCWSGVRGKGGLNDVVLVNHSAGLPKRNMKHDHSASGWRMEIISGEMCRWGNVSHVHVGVWLCTAPTGDPARGLVFGV